MHPTKELLLKHCIQFLGLQRQLATNPGAIVGDARRFVDDLASEVDEDAKRLVLQIHLLALVLDGKVSRRERGLWRECCAATPGASSALSPKYISTAANDTTRFWCADVAVYDAAQLQFTAYRFRQISTSLEGGTSVALPHACQLRGRGHFLGHSAAFPRPFLATSHGTPMTTLSTPTKVAAVCSPHAAGDL